MGVTQYNKIFKFSLVVIALYNILCLADIISGATVLETIISKSAIIYLIYAIAMLCYKIHLTRYYFLGGYAWKNLIAHGVLLGASIVLIII